MFWKHSYCLEVYQLLKDTDGKLITKETESLGLAGSLRYSSLNRLDEYSIDPIGPNKWVNAWEWVMVQVAIGNVGIY